MPRRILLLAALASALAPSASAQVQEDHLQRLATARTEPGPPRRGCGPVRRSLPALASIADSASVMAAIADFAARYPLRDGQTPFALYSLTVTPEGELRPPRPLAYLLPEGEVESFAALLHEALGQGRPPSGSVRLRVTVSASPTVRLEPSERCPAELRTRLRLQSNAMRGTDNRPRPARVRAVVRETGQVVSVQILTGTGSAELDRWIQDVLLRNRAVPGLIDGVPAQMEVDETIQIQTRG